MLGQSPLSLRRIARLRHLRERRDPSWCVVASCDNLPAFSLGCRHIHPLFALGVNPLLSVGRASVLTGWLNGTVLGSAVAAVSANGWIVVVGCTSFPARFATLQRVPD